MEIGHGLGQSILDVRRASEQLTQGELEKFSRNVSINQLSPCTDPIAPTGAWKHCQLSDKVTAYRNLVGVSVSLWFCMSAVFAVISLQSSLNVDQGLGLATLFISTIFQTLVAFVSPTLLSLLGSKYAILTGYVSFSMYTVLNYYPSWYTLTPGAFFLGFSFGAVTWTGVYSQVTMVALRSAASLKENPKYVVALFTGVLTFFIELSYIPGNLVSSIVLFFDQQEGTDVASENLTCNNTEAANLDETYLYIMLSVYMIFFVAAIGIILLFADSLGSDRKFMSSGQFIKQHLKNPCIAVTKMLVNWKLLLLSPMIFLVGLLIATILGMYPKVYVSDCIGVRWVGLVLMGFGISSGVGGFASGRLVKHIPQYVIVYIVSSVFLALLLFLAFWEPSPIHPVLFVVAIVYGICEGSFNSITASFTGILFPHKQQVAFSANRFYYGLGLSAGFILPLVVSAKVHIWLILGLVLVSVLTYSILVFKTLSRDQLLPCLVRKPSEPPVNSSDAELNKA